MSDAASVPAFAVVGHPNKGKSSLVATLAQDDQVRIGAEPGTTTRAIRYPLRLSGEVLYELIDTPGFQRARGVLDWLRTESERHGATAADRPDWVARFCAEPANHERFPDEIALLTPLTEGAGILYVVDGAVPFGSDYEAEMEILRWTGRPSLAVINPIGTPRYVSEWQAALGQYFRVVRVLDALHADFDTRLDLLRAFGELDERWRESLGRAVEALSAERDRRRRSAAAEIAQLLADAAVLSVEERVPKDGDPASFRPALEERYRSELRGIERRARQRIETLYDFDELAVREDDADEQRTGQALLEEDLFSERTWLAFGLRLRDVVTAGAAAGATTGGVIDVALGGATLLAGAALGGLVGGALGWMGAGRLANVEVLRQPLGGQLARFGPSRSPNLLSILLGRARLHHAVVSSRTHARRDRVDLATEAARLEDQLPRIEAAALRRIAKLVESVDDTGGFASDGSARRALEQEIDSLLHEAR